MLAEPSNSFVADSGGGGSTLGRGESDEEIAEGETDGADARGNGGGGSGGGVDGRWTGRMLDGVGFASTGIEGGCVRALMSVSLTRAVETGFDSSVFAGGPFVTTGFEAVAAGSAVVTRGFGKTSGATIVFSPLSPGRRKSTTVRSSFVAARRPRRGRTARDMTLV